MTGSFQIQQRLKSLVRASLGGIVLAACLAWVPQVAQAQVNHPEISRLWLQNKTDLTRIQDYLTTSAKRQISELIKQNEAEYHTNQAGKRPNGSVWRALSQFVERVKTNCDFANRELVTFEACRRSTQLSDSERSNPQTPFRERMQVLLKDVSRRLEQMAQLSDAPEPARLSYRNAERFNLGPCPMASPIGSAPSQTARIEATHFGQADLPFLNDTLPRGISAVEAYIQRLSPSLSPSTRTEVTRLMRTVSDALAIDANDRIRPIQPAATAVARLRTLLENIRNAGILEGVPCANYLRAEVCAYRTNGTISPGLTAEDRNQDLSVDNPAYTFLNELAHGFDRLRNYPSVLTVGINRQDQVVGCFRPATENARAVGGSRPASGSTDHPSVSTKQAEQPAR